jgi:hypothetical protein
MQLAIGCRPILAERAVEAIEQRLEGIERHGATSGLDDHLEAHPPGEGNDEGAGPEANYFGPGDDETESMSIIRVAAPYLSSLSWTCQKRSVRCAVSSDNLP